MNGNHGIHRVVVNWRLALLFFLLSFLPSRFSFSPFPFLDRDRLLFPQGS